MSTARVATDEGGAAAPDEARQHVAPVEVAAEEVTGRGAGVGERPAPRDLGDALLRVVDREDRREDRAARPPARATPIESHAGEPEALPASAALHLGAGLDRGDLDGAGVDRHAAADGVADEFAERVGCALLRRRARRILGSSTT